MEDLSNSGSQILDPLSPVSFTLLLSHTLSWFIPGPCHSQKWQQPSNSLIGHPPPPALTSCPISSLVSLKNKESSLFSCLISWLFFYPSSSPVYFSAKLPQIPWFLIRLTSLQTSSTLLLLFPFFTFACQPQSWKNPII